jgi:hypothetical protein
VPSTPPLETDAPLTEHAAGCGTLPFDARKYQPYFQDMDLSESQRAEVLQILWSVMVTFVDLGFGVDSVRLALPQPKDGPRETDVAAEKTIPAQ